MNCWICGDAADTGEHKTKHSDLRAVLGTPSQKKPVYYHDENIRNRAIGSFKGDFLKSPARLCAHCNNQRTQPHDLAWEQLSNWLRNRNPALKAGEFVQGEHVYARGAGQELLNVHLYFTKLIGCHLVAANANFDRAALAASILNSTPNRYVHLKFGISQSGQLVGNSDLMMATLKPDDAVAFALYAYALGNLVTHVMYAIPGEQRDGLINAWHPRLGTTRLILADFP